MRIGGKLLLVALAVSVASADWHLVAHAQSSATENTEAISLWGRFTQWLEGTPHKHEIRLLAELVLFGIIIWRLKSERVKLEATVGTIGKRLTAIQETVEEAPAEPSPGATPENWERIRTIWAEARERLELLIETGVTDGRRRRKYSNLPRHSYEAVIQNLRTDKVLSANAAADLTAMNTRFMGLRRARAATAPIAQEFASQYQRVQQELPAVAPDEE